MSREPWMADLEIDARTVERIVAAQFPELRPVRATYLGEGWCFFAFAVNDDLCFRFPKRADVEPAIEHEILVVRALRNHLTLPVPENRFVGEAGDDFPRRFAGQARIPGESAVRVIPPHAERPRLARDLGRFLTTLHSFPRRRALDLGLPAWSPRSHTDAGGRMERAIEEARGVLRDDLLARCGRFAERELPAYVAFSGEPVMAHNDLGPVHILLDPRTTELTGVIDWEDAGLGDPAGDFVGLSMWLGPEFVRETLEHYEHSVEPDFEHRVHWWTVWVSVLEARYATLTGDEDLRSAALRALDVHL